MEAITDVIGGLFDLWMEMFEAFIEILPKAISFILWCLSAIVIMPCLFISGVLYPLWVEWGEGF